MPRQDKLLTMTQQELAVEIDKMRITGWSYIRHALRDPNLSGMKSIHDVLKHVEDTEKQIEKLIDCWDKCHPGH